MKVFPGEEFDLLLTVWDQNNNEKVGFYTYPSNMFFTEVDIIEIDLTDDNEDISFAAVDGSFDQKTSLVIRNSTKNFSSFFHNYDKTIVEKNFTLNLIDSSTGIMVCT